MSDHRTTDIICGLKSVLSNYGISQVVRLIRLIIDSCLHSAYYPRGLEAIDKSLDAGSGLTFSVSIEIHTVFGNFSPEN